MENELEPDGSFIVENEAPQVSEPQAFDSNLALSLSASKLDALGLELCDLIEQDILDRAKRDKQYKDGLKRTGMDPDAQDPGGADFEGASNVVHPMLSTSCVDFAARAIKELFPPNGPVKTTIVGEVDIAPGPMNVGAMAPGTDKNHPEMQAGMVAQPLPYDEKLVLAEQKRDFLNWELIDGIPEYRAELEQLLTQLPLGGSQYLKLYFDPTYGRIRAEFVPIDEFVLPYSASSLASALRATHIQRITEQCLKERIQSGFYADTSLTAPGSVPEPTATGKQNERIEGKTEPSENEDGLQDVFECHASLALEDEVSRPYVVSLSREDRKILAVYRNWDESDQSYQRLDWFVEFVFIPWRGAVGVGLPHLIGGLSRAATGALRALLDSGMINNFPGAIKLKSPRGNAQNIQLQATGVSEIDAPAGVDDVRKAIMGLPFNPPSPVLFQLLDWVTNTANQVIATTSEQLSQVGDRTPVGTTMMLAEQGAATYSAIHARLHFSQYRALQIICRLNAIYSTDQDQIRALGKVLFPKEAFQSTKDIAPVSDPNIFSDAQRYGQNQAVLQLAQQTPNLPWNMLEVGRNTLRTLKVPNIDAILPLPPQPFTNDLAFLEHQPALEGKQLTTAPQQNHFQHIQEHLMFIMDPVFGAANPATPPSPGWPALLAHAQRHLLDMYVQMKQQAMQIAMQTYQQQMMQTYQQQMMQMMLQQQLSAGLGVVFAEEIQ